MGLSRTDTNLVTYSLSEGNTTLFMNAAQALDALNGFLSLQDQIHSDNAVVPPPSTVHGFRGIYAFSGSVSSQLQQDPTIAGTYLGYAWSNCEPTEGTFDFHQIDLDMQPWIDQGKKVILRISASGWKKWLTPNLPSWTPKWVYDKGVKNITEDDGSIKPAYWDMKFLLAYQNFITAFAAKYDGNPHVFCIEMGLGDGGESKVDTRKNSNRLQLWQKIGYTDDLWLGAMKEIISYYKAAFKTTPLVLMPDDSFIGGKYGMSTTLDLAVQYNVWVQDNGLVKGEVLKHPAWQKVPVLAEQRNKTANSKDTLEDDLHQAVVNDKAVAVLCFVDDLLNPAYAATLQKYAAMVG